MEIKQDYAIWVHTDSFIIQIKTEDFYKNIANDVERWFDTSNYDEKDNRSLPIGKNKKVIGKSKDELGGKIMTEFCALRAKVYSFLIDDYIDEDYEKNKIINKKAKGTKKCIVKRELMFENYKDSLFNDKIILRSQQRFRSDHHIAHTEEVNKIALNSNDDKRIQTYDKITTYLYGTNIFKICENETLLKSKFNERLNNKSQVTKNKSQVIIDESQVLIKESQALITKSQAIRNKSKAARNNAYSLINQSQALRNEAQSLINQLLMNESQALVSESQELINQSRELEINHKQLGIMHIHL